MDLHASQIQGFFDVPVDKYVYYCTVWDQTLTPLSSVSAIFFGLFAVCALTDMWA